MHNAPYIHPSHDSILKLWRTFPNGESYLIATESAKYVLVDISVLIHGIVDSCKGPAVQSTLVYLELLKVQVVKPLPF